MHSEDDSPWAMRSAGQAIRSAVISVVGVMVAGMAVLHWPQSFGDLWFWAWGAGLAAFGLSLPSAVAARPRWSAGQMAGLAAVIAVGVALRAWAGGAIPAHIDMDELRPGLEALEIAQHPSPQIFSSVGWFAMPRLSFAFPAAFMAVLPGAPFVALRLSSLVMGVGGLVCTALLGRRVVGVQPAFLGSFLMATSFWHLHDSRTGFPFVQTSFCTALVLYLLVRARQDRSRRVLAAAGMCLGLSVQCYFPLRILFVLVPLWWLCVGGERSSLVTLAEMLIVGVATLLTLGPLLSAVSWPVLTERSRFVLTVGSPLIVARHLVEGLCMFTGWAEVSFRNRSSGALLDLGTLGAVVLGGAVAWRRSPQHARALALSIIVVFLLGVVAADNPRAAYRLGPAMPAIFLLAGVGAHHAWTVLRARRSRHRYVPRALALALAVFVLGMNGHHFFVDYARGDGALDLHSAVWRHLAGDCDGREFYLVSGLTPLGSDELLRMFCSGVVHRVDRMSIPDGIQIPDATPATVVMAELDRSAVDIVRHGYPRAAIVERRAGDGQLLLTALQILPDECRAPPAVSAARAIVGTHGARAHDDEGGGDRME